MTEGRKICEKCGKEQAERHFFKMKNGERCELCKSCLTMHIDNRNPQTFLWILEKFDVPYIETRWVNMANQEFKKHPERFGSGSVIGMYIRSMQMHPYKDCTYADTERLNFEIQKKAQDEEARKAAREQDIAFVEELERKFQNGEISRAEYETYKPIQVEPIENNYSPPASEEKQELLPIRNDLLPIATLGPSEEQLREELEEEDLKYLALKWGTNYQPSEWVRMEELYQKYESEYELNTDREDALRKICKISLKLDQAIDIGDLNAVKAYSSTLDSLRKSGKFTEAQNKEEIQTHYLDSIGELVAYCEQETGIIEQFPDLEDYPQDKVDLTIKDLQAYTYNLVSNELGLGDLIESYIKKLEESQKQDLDPSGGLITNSEEKEAAELALEDDNEFEDAYAFSEYLENGIEEDAELILEILGEL